MWMGPLSGMDVALLDQWQLLSHFLQNLIFRFLQSVSLLFSLSMWQLQVLSINACYEHDHATSGLHFLSWVLFCLVSYRASLFKTMLFMFVQKSRIQFWLFEQKDMRIEGRIIVSFFIKHPYEHPGKLRLNCRMCFFNTWNFPMALNFVLIGRDLMNTWILFLMMPRRFLWRRRHESL